MQQEPANEPIRVPMHAIQPYDIGFVVERVIEKLPAIVREQVLEILKQPGVVMIHKLVMQELQVMMFETSGQFNLSPEMFERIRVQVVAVSSILATLNQKGREANEAAAERPLTVEEQQVKRANESVVETPIVTE